MYEQLYSKLESAIETGEPVTQSTALEIMNLPAQQLPVVMGLATRMKLKWFGESVHFCSIMNARSGACSEDCAFCAQSAHHTTTTGVYGMQATDKIVSTYSEASAFPIDRFGVVTAGEGLTGADIDSLCEAIRSGKKNDTEWCASLGLLSESDLQKLIDAGMSRFHHNLETARSFFPNICTTHQYEERIAMVRQVKNAGLSICSGGILGMGESLEQRYEFAKILYDEQVDAIPMNFLVPVKGTRMENMPIMTPVEILLSIVMFRFVNPRAEIKIAAGRLHLRDMQSMIFAAGATGMMIGEYLTVAGRDTASDIQMLEDLGIEVKECC